MDHYLKLLTQSRRRHHVEVHLKTSNYSTSVQCSLGWSLVHSALVTGILKGFDQDRTAVMHSDVTCHAYALWRKVCVLGLGKGSRVWACAGTLKNIFFLYPSMNP